MSGAEKDKKRRTFSSLFLKKKTCARALHVGMHNSLWERERDKNITYRKRHLQCKDGHKYPRCEARLRAGPYGIFRPPFFFFLLSFYRYPIWSEVHLTILFQIKIIIIILLDALDTHEYKFFFYRKKRKNCSTGWCLLSPSQTDASLSLQYVATFFRLPLFFVFPSAPADKISTPWSSLAWNTFSSSSCCCCSLVKF